eukprot:m.281607 g.281607  ORF g.281607 m.281607 type:complete len:105 (-) comp17741_c0_seq10:4340-4654(-)
MHMHSCLYLFWQVLTVSAASALAHPEQHAEHSWSHDHAWSFLTCNRCRAHLGWHFERLADCDETTAQCPLPSFQGLILEALEIVDSQTGQRNTSAHIPRLHRMI